MNDTIRLVSRVWPTALRAGLAAILSAATLIIAAAPARAAGEDTPAQYVVRYTNLDLQTDAGASALYRRIAAAARQVCPDYSREPARVAAMRACRADAIERAVAGVGNERLAAIHAARVQRGSVA